MTNSNVLSLTLTANDGKQHTYTFQPGQVMWDKTSASQATVTGFVIGGKDYYYHAANTKALETAKKIKAAADIITTGVGSRWGVGGGIAGLAVGLGAGAIAQRFVDNHYQEGYYRHDGLVFKGKVTVNLS